MGFRSNSNLHSSVDREDFFAFSAVLTFFNAASKGDSEGLAVLAGSALGVWVVFLGTGVVFSDVGLEGLVGVFVVDVAGCTAGVVDVTGFAAGAVGVAGFTAGSRLWAHLPARA